MHIEHNTGQHLKHRCAQKNNCFQRHSPPPSLPSSSSSATAACIIFERERGGGRLLRSFLSLFPRRNSAPSSLLPPPRTQDVRTCETASQSRPDQLRSGCGGTPPPPPPPPPPPRGHSSLRVFLSPRWATEILTQSVRTEARNLTLLRTAKFKLRASQPIHLNVLKNKLQTTTKLTSSQHI